MHIEFGYEATIKMLPPSIWFAGFKNFVREIWGPGNETFRCDGYGPGTAMEPCSFPSRLSDVEPRKGRLILKNSGHRESDARMRNVIPLANWKALGQQSF